MQPDTLARHLKRGKELCAALARETHAFQRDLESRAADEIQAFVRKRQDLLNELQKLDTHVAEFLQGVGGELDATERRAWEKFLQAREMVVYRVLEMDGELISRAKKQMRLLQEELETIANGRRAVTRYGGRGRSRANQVDLNA